MTEKIEAEQITPVTGKVGFGVGQISNPSPVWATWVFRIVLYAASITTFIVTTAKGIPDSVAINIASYCSMATMVAHALSKMVGIDITKDAQDAKDAFNKLNASK